MPRWSNFLSRHGCARRSAGHRRGLLYRNLAEYRARDTTTDPICARRLGDCCSRGHVSSLSEDGGETKTRTFSPFAFTRYCSFTSSACSLYSSFSYASMESFSRSLDSLFFAAFGGLGFLICHKGLPRVRAPTLRRLVQLAGRLPSRLPDRRVC